MHCALCTVMWMVVLVVFLLGRLTRTSSSYFLALNDKNKVKWMARFFWICYISVIGESTVFVLHDLRHKDTVLSTHGIAGRPVRFQLHHKHLENGYATLKVPPLTSYGINRDHI
jgi:hypothetical protein